VNRRAKSDGDVTEPGSVYGSDRIADDAISNLKLQNGVVTSIKLADGSVLESKVDTDAITETKIRDGSIVTPKLEANAVQAPKIDTSTITGSEFDRIVDGEVVDTQNIISLLADKVIFADTGDTVDGVTTSEGGTTVIQGGKIETGSLTADQIDTLNLDADQITIEGFDSTLRFEVTTGASGDFYEIYASGNPDTVILGGFKSRGGAIAINSQSQNNMNLIQPFDGDNAGSVGESGTAYAEMHAHNFITASPDPIQSVDCDSLCDIDWYDNPPEPVQKRARDIGDSDEEVPDGRDHTPVELGTMANYLLETCKSQQRRIESLEERLDALERQNA